jgi:O-antigen ligase
MALFAEQRMRAVALLAAVVLAAGIVLAPIELVPYLLVAAAAATLAVAWTALGSILTATLCWFVTVIAFDEEFWRLPVPHFFSLTIPRVLVVVLGLIWFGCWVLGRTRLRDGGWLYGLMLMLLALFTTSAAVAGFTSISVASVHYRLIGGFWFAFFIFFLIFHGVNSERDVLRVLKFFLVVGLYLTFTGWCEHLRLWSLVFPRYIADPELGIHWGRVRGPFLVSPTMGLALLFSFFACLALARQAVGPRRWLIHVVCLAMLPVLFWTHTRSVWLGLALGTIIWVLHAGRRWSRVAGISLVTAAAIAVMFFNAENILSEQREVGGVTDEKPIEMRLGLAMITWDMFQDHPVFGVGFGHFRDVAPSYARRLDSPYYYFASSAMEHNNFLSVLAETGAVGLLLYLALLAALLRISFRLYRRLPERAEGPVSRDVLVLYWVLFTVYLVDATFRETSVHPFTNCLFFGVSGVIVALDYLLRPQPLRRVRSMVLPPAALVSSAPLAVAEPRA